MNRLLATAFTVSMLVLLVVFIRAWILRERRQGESQREMAYLRAVAEAAEDERIHVGKARIFAGDGGVVTIKEFVCSGDGKQWQRLFSRVWSCEYKDGQRVDPYISDYAHRFSDVISFQKCPKCPSDAFNIDVLREQQPVLLQSAKPTEGARA